VARTRNEKATNPLEVVGAEGGHAHPLDGGAEPAGIVCGRVVQQRAGQEPPQERAEQPTIGEHGAQVFIGGLRRQRQVREQGAQPPDGVHPPPRCAAAIITRQVTDQSID